MLAEADIGHVYLFYTNVRLDSEPNRKFSALYIF